jgi:hypothetical protein
MKILAVNKATTGHKRHSKTTIQHHFHSIIHLF